MEYCNNVICVTREELIKGDEPIIKEGTLNSLYSRDKFQVVHRGGGEGNRALIVYSSLPEKYRARFEALKGDPAEILKQQELQMKTRIKTDEAARAFYEDYRYEMGGMETSLSDKLKAEYTLNASVLARLIADMDRRAAKARALNNRRTDLWDILLAESEQYREEYGHTLPANLSRLKAKIRDFRRDGYAALISGKVGNVTAVKITQEAKEFSISIEPKELTFEAEGGKYEITVTSSDEWSVSQDDYWLSYYTQNEDNENLLIISAGANFTDQSRSCTLTFICGDKTAELIATQKPDDSPIIQFKDVYFLEALLENNKIDRNGDEQISEMEARLVTNLELTHRVQNLIRNIDELSYFTS